MAHGLMRWKTCLCQVSNGRAERVYYAEILSATGLDPAKGYGGGGRRDFSSTSGMGGFGKIHGSLLSPHD